MQTAVRKVLSLTEHNWGTRKIPARKYGKLAAQYCNKQLPVQVCESASGYYIGTLDAGMPCSRESNEYFRKVHDAEEALLNGTWTQKEYP